MLIVAGSKQSAPHYDGDVGIDFVEVAEKHIAWRARLLSHIHREADEVWLPSDASSYERCQLGTWLRGPQRMLWGNHSAFKRLEIAHAEFHYFAGVILSKCAEGDSFSAERILRNEFSQATRRILIAINEMSAITLPA